MSRKSRSGVTGSPAISIPRGTSAPATALAMAAGGMGEGGGSGAGGGAGGGGAGGGVRGRGDLAHGDAPIGHPAPRPPAVGHHDVGRVGLEEMAGDHEHLLAHGAPGEDGGPAR